MATELPDEIEEARRLLDEFEKPEDHKTRIRCFWDALDMFDYHLEQEPDSPQKNLIANIKRT